MTLRFRAAAWAAVACLLLSVAFLCWMAAARTRRVNYVSGLAGWSVAELAGPGNVPGGRSWQPRLIVPDSGNASYEWLNQTREMAARGDFRVRHVDFENAPFGREVHASSPYRWLLGAVAWIDHRIKGGPFGAALEDAALITDPLIQFLLVVVTSAFVAWRFGAAAAALTAIGLVTLFPFATEFLAGVPDDRGLGQACLIWSVLPLLAGVGSALDGNANAEGRARRWFCIAGIMGGLGLWIGVTREVPVLAGTTIGGLLAAGVSRSRAAPHAPWPWRHWALGGAVTTLVCYLIEYFPNHLGSWDLTVIHPIYGVAWLGAGEMLMIVTPWLGGSLAGPRIRILGSSLLALLLLAALPVAMHFAHTRGFLEEDISLFKFTRIPGEAVAPTLSGWFSGDGPNAREWAAILPLLLLVPATVLVWRRTSDLAARSLLALSLGLLGVFAGLAWRNLGWWSSLDAVLLLLGIAVTSALSLPGKPKAAVWIGCACSALLWLPGAVQLWPSHHAGPENALTEAEVFGLIDRDLSRWLAQRVDVRKATMLTPPDLTAPLHYYAGLRGVATLGLENREGIGAAIRIVSASTSDEALELITRRQITHLVIPSWDGFLAQYARLGMGQLEGSFLGQLHAWTLPRWLRPVAYPLPSIKGFEGQSITIFEVVDEQDDATAASRLTEYFIEMEHLDYAINSSKALRRFPGNLSALVARADVDHAAGNNDDFNTAMEAVMRRLAGDGDRSLPWDRRVSLAILLAQGHQIEASRKEARQCLEEMDSTKLRSLQPLLLYRFQVLVRVLRLEMVDPGLRALALDLLPPAYSSRLRQ